ncbi:MAG: Cys-Gln thioester bond-forming surface protein [Bacilli bacterium]|nr:Cys-Gln thioester bond-forming surface protein [Bacilli bacterium]
MKRLIKLILLIIICFSFKGVKAASLDTSISKNYIDNIWSFHYRNGKVFSYGQLKFNYANGKLAYCIQPETSINFDNYNSYDNWSISGYSEDAKRKMELYAYYGYGFKNHNSIEYYMATQELIWRLSKDEDIVWHTGNNSSTPVIDISKEKNEILRMVSLYKRMPSLNNSVNTLYTTDNYTFTDSNGILELYEISSDLSFTRDKNSITFKLDKLGTYEVYLNPIKNGYDRTIVYDREDSSTQDLATFKMPDVPSGKFIIKVEKVKVRINKRDKETNELINDSGNKILINDKEYEFKDGYIELRLGPGDYSIKEINASNGYYINSNELKFSIEEDSSNKEIDFYNEKTKGKVEIRKTNEDGVFLENVKFEIYDENNNKVDEIITSKNEYDYSKELPLGNYTLKEVKTNYGYELDNKVYNVSLKYNNDKESIVIKHVDIVNKKILCEITFISSDELDNRINTSYEVYDSNMNVIYKGNTINGEAKLELNYGIYYIKETSVENGYKLNNKLVKFEVNDNYCTGTLTINNDKTIMPITSTSKEVWPYILLILDVLGLIYVKKNH